MTERFELEFKVRDECDMQAIVNNGVYFNRKRGRSLSYPHKIVFQNNQIKNFELEGNIHGVR